MLTETDLFATVESIAANQTKAGLVLWFPGGHADPWNHVECAMALDVGGRAAEAELAYEWLAANQRPDGSWHQYYTESGVEDAKFDANTIAYVATGVWHHWLMTADAGFLLAMWPVVERAVDWVLELQKPTGEILWARHPDGTPWPFALLTGSSSVAHSLQCAVAVAAKLGHERPDWELSLALLRECIADRPEHFEPKDRWAMDWYYPVLCGAVGGERALSRLRAGWSTFVIEGVGVRCVSDRPWVTAAETCEAVLAHLAVGETGAASALFDWAQDLRDDDGSYWTGIVVPDRVHFPGGERSTYTAAAVVLADDAITGRSPASRLFVGEAEEEADRLT